MAGNEKANAERAAACRIGGGVARNRPGRFAKTNEQPRSKLRGIEHPSLNSFRGKPRGIEPEEIDTGPLSLKEWTSTAY